MFRELTGDAVQLVLAQVSYSSILGQISGWFSYSPSLLISFDAVEEGGELGRLIGIHDLGRIEAVGRLV
ncbi:MAG: hypothetical protein E5V89_02870 [Mesorhizobium sp.]|nr:MAG: hypothetical protein E5V89_02870 [Mesorhizobium sp.]